MAGAADDGVVTRAVAARRGRARAARLIDFESATAGDGGRAEGTGDRGIALLVDRGIARTDVDGVVTRGAMLVDHAAGAEGQRIVAAADDDLARTCDIDRIVAITGDYGA